MAGVYAIVQGKSVGTCSNVDGRDLHQSGRLRPQEEQPRQTSRRPARCQPPPTGAFATGSGCGEGRPVGAEAAELLGHVHERRADDQRQRDGDHRPVGQILRRSAWTTRATTGISAAGSTNVNLGCGMITNSMSMDAAVAFGSSTVDGKPDRGGRRHRRERQLGRGHRAAAVHDRRRGSVRATSIRRPRAAARSSRLDTGNNNKPGGTST